MATGRRRRGRAGLGGAVYGDTGPGPAAGTGRAGRVRRHGVAGQWVHARPGDWRGGRAGDTRR